MDLIRKTRIEALKQVIENLKDSNRTEWKEVWGKEIMAIKQVIKYLELK